MAQRVAVIGAGPSGLMATKCCLDEGLDPVCFERTDGLGGLWNFSELVKEDQGSVMRSTTINSSKEMMAFSDFPVPKEFPNFMHHTQVLDYLNMYADTFDLKRYITYNKEVVSVKPSDNYDETGSWDVRVRDHVTGSDETTTFDGILVCTGHHATKHVPTFPGQEDYQGEIIHSQEYRDWTGYTGKRVVVVGIGNSGADLAVELSIVGKVFWSTRRGAWVTTRNSDKGIPGDIQNIRRYLNDLNGMFPKLSSALAIRKLNQRFDHELYGLKPKHAYRSQHPVKNDAIPVRIATGTIQIKPDIRRFSRRGVEFADGSHEDNIDSVMLATGFNIGFPFIDKSIIDIQKNRVKLFKYVFPPDLSKQTLAVIGCVQPFGSILPLAEMQSRLATRVFKGTCQLPTREDMWKDIENRERLNKLNFIQSQRHTIEVNYINYLDELANILGCRPKIGQIFLKDPKLGLKLYFGPMTTYQYRLSGPGAWSGAREAIMTQMDRLKYPLHRNAPPAAVPKTSASLLSKLSSMKYMRFVLGRLRI